MRKNKSEKSGVLISVVSSTVLLILLKKLGIIDWPWWIIFSPVWGSVSFGVMLIIAFGAFMAYIEGKNN